MLQTTTREDHQFPLDPKITRKSSPSQTFPATPSIQRAVGRATSHPVVGSAKRKRALAVAVDIIIIQKSILFTSHN